MQLPWETGFGRALFGGPSFGPKFQLPMIGRYDRYEGFAEAPKLASGSTVEQWSAQLSFPEPETAVSKVSKNRRPPEDFGTETTQGHCAILPGR